MGNEYENKTDVLELHHLRTLIGLLVYLGQILLEVIHLKFTLFIKLVDSDLRIQDTLNAEETQNKLQKLFLLSLWSSLSLLLALLQRGVHNF